MANITNNRLNTIATPAQISAVKTAIQNINTNLPFLIGLTTEERITLPSIDVGNKIFTEDAITAGFNNSSLLPSYISLPNVQNDLALFTQLDEILFSLKQLVEKIEDTQLLAGSEAYSTALIIYKLFGSAANVGIPGTDTIVNQLKQRFVNNRSKSEPATFQPPPTN
ncbi:MAG: hypothetical protein V4572_13385 [Bacteroidota bacterium]